MSKTIRVLLYLATDSLLPEKLAHPVARSTFQGGQLSNERQRSSSMSSSMERRM
jgi:hypothetical protein